MVWGWQTKTTTKQNKQKLKHVKQQTKKRGGGGKNTKKKLKKTKLQTKSSRHTTK